MGGHGVSEMRVFPLLSLVIYFLLFYIKTSSKPSNSLFTLLPYDWYWIASTQIVTPEGVISGAVEIKGGNIVSVVKGNYQNGKIIKGHVVNYGDDVIMPGLIDVMMKGKNSRENMGYAFVTFRTKDLGAKAIEDLNNTKFQFVVHDKAPSLGDPEHKVAGIDWNFNIWGGGDDGCYGDWSLDFLVSCRKEAGC